MTRDEIISMAREVGMLGILSDVATTFDELERFAACVEERAAAQERKGWQDMVKKILVEVKKSDERFINLFKINNELIELIQKAKSQEREECAKVVEIFDRTFQTGGGIAGSIRARGNDT